MDVQAGQAPVAGLTAAEADARARRGEHARSAGPRAATRRSCAPTSSPSTTSILFVIGAALLALGRYSDALISVGLGLLNAVISAVQEIRAKRKLDRLQLLDRAPVLVVRDGREVEVAPDDGRARRRAAGAPRRPDRGRRAAARRRRGVEADESLLTGESDPVVKEPGDDLRSGSLCVAGERPPAGPRRRGGELRRAAHRARPAGSPPTRPRCSGASSSSSGWSWR